MVIAGGHYSVLVVEDEADIVFALRDSLEHDGYELEAAEASFELLVSKLRGAHRP